MVSRGRIRTAGKKRNTGNDRSRALLTAHNLPETRNSGKDKSRAPAHCSQTARKPGKPGTTGQRHCSLLTHGTETRKTGNNRSTALLTAHTLRGRAGYGAGAASADTVGSRPPQRSAASALGGQRLACAVAGERRAVPPRRPTRKQTATAQEGGGCFQRARSKSRSSPFSRELDVYCWYPGFCVSPGATTRSLAGIG
jgi:hypothetical protein